MAADLYLRAPEGGQGLVPGKEMSALASWRESFISILGQVRIRFTTRFTASFFEARGAKPLREGLGVSRVLRVDLKHRPLAHRNTT